MPQIINIRYLIGHFLGINKTVSGEKCVISQIHISEVSRRAITEKPEKSWRRPPENTTRFSSLLKIKEKLTGLFGLLMRLLPTAPTVILSSSNTEPSSNYLRLIIKEGHFRRIAFNQPSNMRVPSWGKKYQHVNPTVDSSREF